MVSLYIIQQITIYVGFVLLFAGILGNGINIFIFSTVDNYRKTPCAFYLLVTSIFNNIYIVIILPSRITSGGFGIDLTNTSLVWCKIRPFLIGFLGLTSFTCSCLATIDQFLVTSRSANLRRCSKIEWTHRIVFVVILVWCLHAIPCLVFYNISPISSTCEISDPVYTAYIPIYLLVLLCAIPVLVLTIFGSLTYRNIRQTIVLAEQNADRQLARMTLMQIVLVVISIIPYGGYTAYSAITLGVAKDANRQLQESFVEAICALISYFYYAGNFYVFSISSSRFRQTVKERVFRWRRRNQINPS